MMPFCRDIAVIQGLLQLHMHVNIPQCQTDLESSPGYTEIQVIFFSLLTG